MYKSKVICLEETVGTQKKITKNCYRSNSILCRAFVKHKSSKNYLSVTYATPKRTFSVFKRLKTYLRATMNDERLIGLALAYINKDNLGFNNVTKKSNASNAFIEK